MRAFTILILALTLPTTLAAQTVYKCTEANGTVVYSERPCATDPAQVETIDTSPSLLTGSGGSISEQGEFAQMNTVRRNCDSRVESIASRYADQYRRIAKELADVEQRATSTDYRMRGSTYQSTLRSQVESLERERDALQADESEELAAAEKRCRKEVKAEEKRQAKAQEARAQAQRAAEQAAAEKAAEEAKRAAAQAKLKQDPVPEQ